MLFPAASGKHTFKSAWRARRAQVHLLAGYAECKLNRAKRIPVPDDTTLWKQWKDTGRSCGIQMVTQPMLTVLLLKMCGSRCAAEPNGGFIDLDRERIKDLVFEFLDVSCDHHDDQLYLSEYVAYKARQRIFNIESVSYTHLTLPTTPYV